MPVGYPVSGSEMKYTSVKQEDIEDGASDASVPRERSRVRPLVKHLLGGAALAACFLLGRVSTHWDTHPTSGIEMPWAPDLMSSLSTKPTKFLGSFVTSNPYRGKPGPKLDEAWMRWHDFPLLRVTGDDVKKSFSHETDPEYMSTVIEMEGGGYLATIELFHQMHCLNMVRMATHHDYYKDKGEYGNQTNYIRRTHTDHCIEILRQIIMCNSDTGLVPYHWVHDNPAPYPDVNTWHQCRDPEVVYDWAMERWRNNGIDYHLGVTRLPGAKDLDHDP